MYSSFISFITLDIVFVPTSFSLEKKIPNIDVHIIHIKHITIIIIIAIQPPAISADINNLVAFIIDFIVFFVTLIVLFIVFSVVLLHFLFFVFSCYIFSTLPQ